MNYLEKYLMMGIIFIIIMLIWGGKTILRNMIKYPLEFITSIVMLIILFGFL